ncbi:NADH-quinone oxidoreductase subunit J [Cytobacillus sp. IB215316]|uniref:NADH-quinone oxidoreductase subunit J n=1 Tax=Cytobacillus sp. IB215316 TaxID=3097354 RepID=UPI002A15A5E2|nr:NADH-quinone oxidoreductase subunit J [Cytobacillus sp. IB215316]MDX8361084.1 NADH-quinone oxidoreductase subunit J [Cytobacillus sp. IB215316]
MSGEFIALIVLSLIAIIGSILMLSLTKVVHMVISLVFTFISIAGVYVLLSAEFVAAVQILIYSGAITIIMLFGIMLTRHNDETGDSKASMLRKLLTLVGVIAFGIVVMLGIVNLDFGQQATTLHVENTKQIGIALYSKFVIPFELMSVLLLVALIGAIILAKKDDEEADNK